jgi:2-oxoglutarate dehydrogenase E2 component (dihydrolipoamide succinyltransferase)
MSTEVKVPVLGESITEATLGQWLKKPGEAVAIDEPIASLETDKVAIEVPSPVAGIMGAYAVEEGATVNVGAVIGSIDAGTGATAPVAAPAPAMAVAAVAPAVTTIAAPAAEAENSDLPLSPAVRRLVLELGIDPSKIKGTGKDGRLTKEDVVAAAKGAPAPSADATFTAAPTTQATGARQEERVKMTRLRQTIAKRLKSAQDTAALLTTFNDVDMSAVIEARATYKDLFEKKHGVRLGFMGFFTKAVALAARDVPSVNAKIEGDEIVYHNYLDVSVAVSAPNGLVVPVVRNADAMSFAQIEKAIGDFGAKAKAGTLTMDDMSGGTFTISNGGVFGSLM